MKKDNEKPMPDTLKPFRVLRTGVVILFFTLIIMAVMEVRFIILGPLFIVFAASIFITTMWPCPGCGKTMCFKLYGIFIVAFPFVSRCMHCGYKIKGSHQDDAA